MRRLNQHLHEYFESTHFSKPVQDMQAVGQLTRMVGLTLEAKGCHARVGECCHIVGEQGIIEAEVVGFSGHTLYLMPLGRPEQLHLGAQVIPTGHFIGVGVGDALLGRVIDGRGQALDQGGPLTLTDRVSLQGKAINPLLREPIRKPLDVGIRAINGLLTVGRGQRLGLMAGSGVGKSMLLGMMTRYAAADVVVVGLIGERSREVREFIEDILGQEGLARAVVVAAPADDPPLQRLHGALVATSIAEYFRSQGKDVLLLMDSLTRFAQAQREIALSVGEPPATKGYPPSVFTKIPSLVERAGTCEKSGGSITGFYTVLADGDDQLDPVVDSARAILDGHFVLSRALAEQGHYPAIDIEASISRVMTAVVDGHHQSSAQTFRQYYARYRQNEDFIRMGAYQAGTDPILDRAIQLMPKMQAYLQQSVTEHVDWEQSKSALDALLSEGQALDETP